MSYFGVARPARPGEEDLVRAELERIAEELSQILGRGHRWTGTVTLSESALFSGLADPSGHITIATSILDRPADRWRSLIHEILHNFSPTFTRTEYRAQPGWEEAVVESLQRLHRQRVLTSFGVLLGEDEFSDGDRRHLYNPYIEAVERVRAVLTPVQAPSAFYAWLQAVPLVDRFRAVDSAINALAEEDKRTARIQLRLAHATLTRSVAIR